jgi:hypothetical protein
MSNEIPDLPASSLSMPTPHDDGPLFPLGQTVATPGALAHCSENNVSPALLLARHQHGDWGDTCETDSEANEQALFDGGRLLSVFKVAQEKIYVITEWDRSVTTILKASEY